VDLNVSPDLEAYYCYGLVLALGALTGARQVAIRLGGIRGIWFLPRTWLLFAAYVAVPLGLFWLLDRTGAINDTSFFAAVLVGVGYERIITGGSETLQAPGEASRFWTPFLAYADRVERLVREQIARSQARLDERVIGAIVNDPQRFEALEALAMSRSPDMQNLQSQLTAINQTGANRGEAALLERKARLLYGVLVAIPDGYFLMKSKGIISPSLYWFYLKRIGTFFQSTVAFLFLIAIIFSTVWYFDPDYEADLARYYVWRISKTNSTSYDQFRARQRLLNLMNDPTVAARASGDLAGLLRRPGFPMDRVDLVLQTVLESNARPPNKTAVPLRLVEALRSGNVDARARINDVLKFLAVSCPTKLDEEIDRWQPNKGDSTVVLEGKIKYWADYWHRCDV